MGSSAICLLAEPSLSALKHLGDKFDKTAVLATLQANAERKPKVQSKQDTIGKLIDIQSRDDRGQRHWL